MFKKLIGILKSILVKLIDDPEETSEVAETQTYGW